MNIKELEALLKLLDDKDQFVVDQVEEKLKEYYAHLPSSIWSNFYKGLSQPARQRLHSVLTKFNYDKSISLMQTWLENPLMLSEALFVISRVLNPCLEYHQFLSQILRFTRHFPEDFSKNYSPLEQARYAIRIFYKVEGYQWYHTQPFVKYLNPEYVVKHARGSHITWALIIIAVLQHMDIHWLLLSNMALTHSYIVVPANAKKLLYFFIDPRTGDILSTTPLSQTDVETLLQTGLKHYNLLNIKSLILAFLLDGVLPREMDDIWQIFNRFNTMIANSDKNFK